MGVYILWFLLCIIGIGMCILSLISANQYMPRVQKACLLLGVVLFISTVGISMFDFNVKAGWDTYFLAMQSFPLLMSAWIIYFAAKQLRHHRSAH